VQGGLIVAVLCAVSCVGGGTGPQREDAAADALQEADAIERLPQRTAPHALAQRARASSSIQAGRSRCRTTEPSATSAGCSSIGTTTSGSITVLARSARPTPARWDGSYPPCRSTSSTPIVAAEYRSRARGHRRAAAARLPRRSVPRPQRASVRSPQLQSPWRRQLMLQVRHRRARDAFAQHHTGAIDRRLLNGTRSARAVAIGDPHIEVQLAERRTVV
jgi:hypothetical protein